MALDPFLLTLKQDSRELTRMTKVALERGWAIVGKGLESVTLICASQSGSKGPRNISSNTKPSDSHYDFLDSIGIVAVAGNASAGNLKLSGGSVSECLLRREETRWFVIKRTSESKLTNLDSWDRHIFESQFLATLDIGGNTLFPSSTSKKAGEIFEATMPFIPAYTLGEIIVQRRLSKFALREKISSIFRSLETVLYCRRGERSLETYVDKVARRLSLLIEKSNVRQLVEVFYHLGAEINGCECRPIRELLNIAQSDPRCREILYSADPRLCHGDLIPEDTLILPGSDQFVLVDPNPQNKDPLVDLGKMAMSALVAYDLAIRDWVTCNVVMSHRLPRVQLSALDEWQSLALEQEEIGRWICDDARQLVSQNVLADHRVEPRAILLLAGLQAMAIPVFHALHHSRDDRAIYFLAKGHWLAEQALRAYGI